MNGGICDAVDAGNSAIRKDTAIRASAAHGRLIVRLLHEHEPPSLCSDARAGCSTLT
jgi:hypothetical protein